MKLCKIGKKDEAVLDTAVAVPRIHDLEFILQQNVSTPSDMVKLVMPGKVTLMDKLPLFSIVPSARIALIDKVEKLPGDAILTFAEADTAETGKAIDAFTKSWSGRTPNGYSISVNGGDVTYLDVLKNTNDNHQEMKVAMQLQCSFDNGEDILSEPISALMYARPTPSMPLMGALTVGSPGMLPGDDFFFVFDCHSHWFGLRNRFTVCCDVMRTCRPTVCAPSGSGWTTCWC